MFRDNSGSCTIHIDNYTVCLCLFFPFQVFGQNIVLRTFNLVQTNNVVVTVDTFRGLRYDHLEFNFTKTLLRLSPKGKPFNPKDQWFLA